MYDLIVRNGCVVDGSGLSGFVADVGVSDGVIDRVGGTMADGAKHEIDAIGKIVCPGFIDPHAHFDAQLLFDGQARPMPEHGVTTVVTGNCSLSFAPMKERDRTSFVKMFQLIEEMPDAVFEGAFQWNWESFDGYVKAIGDSLAINVVPLVGHTAIRMWVMGGETRAATADEIRQMQELLRLCIEAGAGGLSTSCIDSDPEYQPVPCRYAYGDEFAALCEVVGEYGKVLQVVPEFFYLDLVLARIDQLADISIKYGITTTISPLFDSGAQPERTDVIMRRIKQQQKRGARIWPQVQTRAIDISFTFDIGSVYFGNSPIWYRTLLLPREEKLEKLRDAEYREKMVSAVERKGNTDRFADLVVRDSADQSIIGKSLRELADERGSTPANVMIDVSLEEDLKTCFIAENMDHDNIERVGPLLADDYVHIGASDAGAHIQSFATYGDTGYLFSEFVRKGGYLSLEQAVKKITLDTASIWGIQNRGLLRKGYAADLVIFDAATIGRGPEVPVHDLPGKGMRYVRQSQGISTTIVNGEVVWTADDGYTNACSGMVLA